jgi:hypothetical protein
MEFAVLRRVPKSVSVSALDPLAALRYIAVLWQFQAFPDRSVPAGLVQ